MFVQEQQHLVYAPYIFIIPPYLWPRLLAKSTFPTIVSCPVTLRIGQYLFYIEIFINQFKAAEKMIGHRTCFQENDDLALKKPPFFNARGLITRENMRSRDAQCSTGNGHFGKRMIGGLDLRRILRLKINTSVYT